MRNYCTLFDKNYLTKGLSLYSSLQRHSSEPFKLWVLPLDPETQYYLEQHWNVLPHVRLVGWFEIPENVRELVDYRPWNQFCWTLAAILTREIQRITDEPVTYLDSDLYFFADPEICHDEMDIKEVGIVPHRFPAHDAERLRPAGAYNVSWVTFKTGTKAKALLNRWCDQVISRCDATTCGDQRYLDEWSLLITDNLHVFQSKGIGPGPWNTYTYKILEGRPQGPTLDGEQLVFYHFHELQRKEDKTYKLTGYPVTYEQNQYIYRPYIRALDYYQYHIDRNL